MGYPEKDSAGEQFEDVYRKLGGLKKMIDGGPGTDVGSNIEVLATPIAINSFTTADIDMIVVSDTKSGGVFQPYAGSLVADDGVIILDGNGNKWKRVIDNGVINVLWYPVVENVAMDAIFAKILTAANSQEIIPSPNIYFPANTASNKYYYFTSTINLSTKMRLFGDGVSTVLKFATNVTGITTDYITSRFTTIHDILLDGSSGAVATGSPLGSNWSNTQYGVAPKDIIYMNNVTTRYFAGNGFHLYGNSGAGSNLNNSIIVACSALQNRMNGFYIQGQDANKIKIADCDATGNGAEGFKDLSFLGNYMTNNHSASNCSPEIAWQRGLVKDGSNNVYMCIVEGTVGIEPGVTVGWQSSWLLLSGTEFAGWSAYPSVLLYNATTIYYIGGAYHIEGASQYGIFTGNYAEADQPSSFISAGTLSLGFNAVSTLRTGSAAVLRASTALYTTGEIWTGKPGDFTALRTYLSSDGVGMTKAGGTGMKMAWDSTKSRVEFKGLASAEGVGSVFIPYGATAANQGRPTYAKNSTLGSPNGILLASPTSRTAYNLLDMAKTLPAITNLEWGDLFLCSGGAWNYLKTENIVAKVMNQFTTSTGVLTGAKVYLVKGFFEDVLTAASGTVAVAKDYSIATDRGILYDVQFVGSDATNSCVLNHQVLVVNRGGTCTVVQDLALRADYVPGTFATVAFQFSISTNTVTVNLINLPSGTNGKVNIKRIDY